MGIRTSSTVIVCALAAGTALALFLERPPARAATEPGAASAPGEGSEASMLLDPGFVARAACGGTGRTTGLFRPTIQLAALGDAVPEDTEPPLFGGLGRTSWPVSTASPLAQAYFDQGLRWAYAFNHAEAARAFRSAQRHDASCAMCAWGEALVLGPNINAPMAEDAREPALAALERARAHADRATDKERALIEALSARYSDDPQAERPALDAAYAEAMREVASAYPADLDIAVLTAEAMMDTQPWDYWQAGGVEAKGYGAEIVAALERVLERDPDHPGAIHYYIHAVEASARPERAEPHADRLAGLMPAAGHIVHMPSHIYYRIGRYKDSLAINHLAVAADEAYFEQATPSVYYGGGYYPHNVHFLLVSAQMAGARDTAVDAAEKLNGLVPDDVAREIGWVQLIKAAPDLALAQFGDADALRAMERPGEDFPFLRALRHYALAVTAAGRGEVEQARAQDAAIAEIAERTDFTALSEGGVPADQVLQIARKVVEARIAQAEERFEDAVAAFRAAVALEDELAYLEPPYWYYPTRQSLGAALLQAGRPEEAEQVLRETLVDVPNNAWALFALAKAQEARGDTVGAAATRASFERAWAGEAGWLTLARV
jgi:tetratricopeptide (TPR) repeat protein